MYVPTETIPRRHFGLNKNGQSGPGHPKPVKPNALEEFGGHVDLGELKVIGTVPAPDKGNSTSESAHAPVDSR